MAGAVLAPFTRAHSREQRRRDDIRSFVMEQARTDFRRRHPDARRRMELRVEEYECKGLEGAKDHVAEATIVGTALTRFGQDQARSERIASQMVLSLGDRARPADFAASARERP